jgi:hypothetical protein
MMRLHIYIYIYVSIPRNVAGFGQTSAAQPKTAFDTEDKYERNHDDALVPMNVAADAEQRRLMRGSSRGLGNAKLGTSQEDNDDDNDDDVNNPMALMLKVSPGQARSMFVIQADSGMTASGKRWKKKNKPRFGKCWTKWLPVAEDDAACQGDLVCARKGYDGRDFGDCLEKHCCTPPPPPVIIPSDWQLGNWEKRTKRSCYTIARKWKSNFEEAILHCKDMGEACQGIYDRGCDGKGPFRFCKFYKKSSTYVKQDGPGIANWGLVPSCTEYYCQSCVYQHTSHIKA